MVNLYNYNFISFISFLQSSHKPNKWLIVILLINRKDIGNHSKVMMDVIIVGLPHHFTNAIASLKWKS